MAEEPVEEVRVKSEKPKKERHKSECYMVKIDNTWFLAKGDWTEYPTFANKFSKARVAQAEADAEKARFTDKHIRVVRAKQVITIEEIE